MEKEAAVSRRRMKMIAAHLSTSLDDISANSHLLIPMNCSGSLKSTFSRCDNRLHYARQSSASQAFFMRQQHSTHHNQVEKALKCSESAAQAQPFYSRPTTTLMEPKPKPNDGTLPHNTQLPKFARPSSITFHSNGNEWSPRMDVAESGGSYIISVEIPGVTVNDIRVELSETNLRIMGKRSRESVCGAYHKREIIQEPYQVSWPLPFDANKVAVSAEFLDGILQIIVPKL